MGFDIGVPSPDEAPAVSDVHLRAMDANLLTHAQFPSPAARAFFREWLARNTLQQVRNADKGVLVARDAESGAVASFVKWLVHAAGGDEAAARDLEGWSDVCERTFLDSYGELTEGVRKQVMGEKPYYHVTFLCTDPSWGGRGAASKLLRRVQELAAADGVAIILEATMEGVALYQKLGFETAQELHMMLPRRGSSEPSQPYEERCMVWTPPGGGSNQLGPRDGGGEATRGRRRLEMLDDKGCVKLP
ncbi:hypothetical protein TOPH_07168 [Tolypocladium ophioglossoides CBS 100239]|uniref:N-acetyltransferase domain-containing protein n=1 Tax=Tolypocladium ophioglossoides (strain CBS 100239) TaxID=1163406 RepID=A0A0L0N296_TOLOC|nr:hypothetical protein TOPH_07168 [Tolypocladium ophioglossoides CBS 100239]